MRGLVLAVLLVGGCHDPQPGTPEAANLECKLITFKGCKFVVCKRKGSYDMVMSPYGACQPAK